MMKILMVIYDNDSYITAFPQGLAYLASAARDAGHDVDVYQQDIYHWPDAHLTEHLNAHHYDVVAVSVIGGYYQYRKLLALSEAINASKNRSHFCYTIGGHGPSSDPAFYLRKSGADAVGIGEGEISFVNLVSAVQNGDDLSTVNGIAYLDANGDCIKTAPQDLIADIDTISWPAYDLFDITYYALSRYPNIRPSERALPVLSGRGCTFACNFCYRMDKGFRPRRSEKILEEVDFLQRKYNISYINFSDELLMSSADRTLSFCKAIKDSGLKFKWMCNGRLNYASKDVLSAMKDSGCVFINYGIESLDDATLKVMHKALTKDIIIKGIENTLEVGISPGLNIIFGNIDEPLSALDADVEFLLRYDDHAQMRTIRPVTPYPGCELFDIAVRRGLLKDTEDFYENKHTNSDLLAVNFTQYTDDEVYEALYRANSRLLKRYYELQQERSEKICQDLYFNKDASFRGFRQT